VDPINNPASLNYYAYGWDTDRNAYALAAKLDSDKYLSDSAAKDGGNDDTAFETRPIAWKGSGTATIQPGPEGKDTYYGTVYTTGGCPDCADLYIGGWGDWYYDFLEFDLTSSPTAAQTVKAELWVYGSAPNNPAIQINRITASWTEAGVTSASNPASSFYANMSAVPSTANWVVTDITSLYQGWKNGTYINYGVKLVPTLNNQTNGSIASSDNATAANRPKLVVTYVP